MNIIMLNFYSLELEQCLQDYLEILNFVDSMKYYSIKQGTVGYNIMCFFFKMSYFRNASKTPLQSTNCQIKNKIHPKEQGEKRRIQLLP